jgi:hypothetical protein
MTGDRSPNEGAPGLLGALLAPLRVPQRVIADIETIASVLLSMQPAVEARLASVDDRAGELLRAVGALREPLERVDREVAELQKIEQAITVRIDALHADLNERMLAVEHQVHTLHPPIAEMSRDLASALRLLPEPSDGPFARLKDTLTAS